MKFLKPKGYQAWGFHSPRFLCLGQKYEGGKFGSSKPRGHKLEGWVWAILVRFCYATYIHSYIRSKYHLACDHGAKLALGLVYIGKIGGFMQFGIPAQQHTKNCNVKKSYAHKNNFNVSLYLGII